MAATVSNGRFVFNGQRMENVIGRSSFKLANILSYPFTGTPGYTEADAQRWVEYNQSIFGERVVLRVFLETAGWKDGPMFGSSPIDKGQWRRHELRDGNRTREVHPVMKRTLEWFFKTSQETGVAFELTIDATMKHDDIPKGEIDHVIRVVGVEMGRLINLYPRALIIPNLRNEWNAHNYSRHTLHEVNMWAVRWHRDQYTPGWDAPITVDGGGANRFDYDVGPGPGKYRAGFIHPERGEGWEHFPSAADVAALRRDARGMPIGFNESMYYVEHPNPQHGRAWYGAGGWTSDFRKYVTFLEQAPFRVDYFIIHDEKGVQCDPEWPVRETKVEAWAREMFEGTNPQPRMRYESIIALGYRDILGRDPDQGGLEAYNYAIENGMTEAQFREHLLRSDEFEEKNPGGA